MNFDTNRALYLQIADELRRRMIAGTLQPGERILPVRQFSAELGVTPNTMQRAFADLEREGLIYTDRTSGRFVTEDVKLIRQLRRENVRSVLQSFSDEMRALGYDQSETMEMLKEVMEEYHE